MIASARSRLSTLALANTKCPLTPMSTKIIATTSTTASSAARSRLLAGILRQVVGAHLAIGGPHAVAHRAQSLGVVVPVEFAVDATACARDECGASPPIRGVGVNG